MSGHYQVTKLTAAQDEYEEEITTFGYAVVGTKNVIKTLAIITLVNNYSTTYIQYHLASHVCMHALILFTLSH